MIEIDILGCGEAFDPDRANSAVLVTAEGFRLLIDCGQGVPRAIWQRSDDANFIDAVYFTHLHVDHCGGLPALVDHMAARRRVKPLPILAPDDGLERVASALAFAAWPNADLPFPVPLLPATRQESIGPLRLATAQTDHAATNYALRLELGEASFFYSGDGRPTVASRALMAGARVAFHETQAPSGSTPTEGHADFETVTALLDSQSLGQLWLYHTEARADATFAQKLRALGNRQIRFAEAGQIVRVR